MDILKIEQSKLNVEEITNLVSSPACGAISLFVGTTRDNFEGKQVLELEYEAYEPMAIKAMKNLCNQIREKWKVENIAIFHRLGIVPVKEASVVLAVSSCHRKESLDAVNFAINQLKSNIPIWKKEVYAGESSEWKENSECPWKRKDDVKLDQEIRGDESDEEMKILDISPHLIQIRADSSEVRRRIDAFINRKREQVNISNTADFCSNSFTTKENSCARVDAILVRRKDSKSHLRVRKVNNEWGPQTREISPTVPSNNIASGSNSATNTGEPIDSSKPISDFDCIPGLEERIQNAEKYLFHNSPVPREIYARLKNIEDRILYLESISPEYLELMAQEFGQVEKSEKRFRPVKKKIYSFADLDSKIQELESKMVKQE